MRLSALAALMILTTVVLSACEQQTVAALDDHSNQFYGRSFVAPRVPRQPGYLASNNVSAYSMAAPVAMPVTSSVTLDSVSSNDLPPPAVASFPSKPTPAPAATTAAGYDWPVAGKVIEDFRTQGEGIVIAAKKGAAIHASAPGEVAYVGSQMKDYGNIVIVRHASGDLTSYAHASEIIVNKGDKVKQGDVLGYVGQTGRAPQPMLHFAIRSGERTIDPLTRLPQQYAVN